MEQKKVEIPEKCMNCVYNNKRICDKDFCSFSECIYEDNLSSLIKNNHNQIQKTAVVNPTISKDDEWFDEDCWDKDYKE